MATMAIEALLNKKVVFNCSTALAETAKAAAVVNDSAPVYFTQDGKIVFNGRDYTGATLDNTGKVPASMLPSSFVEEVIEVDALMQYAYSVDNDAYTYYSTDTPDAAFDQHADPDNYVSYKVLPQSGKIYLAVPRSIPPSAGFSVDNGLFLLSKSGEGFGPADVSKSVIYVSTVNNKIYRVSNEGEGRVVEISQSYGTTDDVPEGSNRLYFTVARAKDALGVNTETKWNNLQAVLDGGTPSGDFITTAWTKDGNNNLSPVDTKAPSEKLVLNAINEIANQMLWG